MPRFEDNNEGSWAAGRVPGRFYVSKRFTGQDSDVFAERFAYEVVDRATGEVTFESDEGWEVVLKETPATRQQLKAIFFETSRGVTHIAFQRFAVTGRPINDKKTLLLGQDEVEELLAFLRKIELAELHGADGVRFSTETARQLMGGVGIPQELLRDRASDVAEFLRHDIAAPEITALARRRTKLAEFRELIASDPSEPECQAWLEEEPWVLGFGAAPQFLHRVGERLEQVVAGFDIEGSGSRPDALMRTAARLSALVFVEIKRPGAALLKSSHYRPDAWVPDADVVGGVAQVHAAIDAARKTIGDRHRVRDAEGFETDVVAELCRPRSVLVVGRLDSLCDAEGRPHRGRFRSFESFRRSLREPEVITFDELIDRAEAAVTLGDSSHDTQ